MVDAGPPPRMTPGQRWMLAAVLAVGMSAGLGLFTFGYAKGASYLTNDPRACANCHVMSEHYAAWTKASHHAVATCNDCHTPHDLVGKYTVKAKSGFWHSFYFTVGGYPDPLRITEGGRKVTEATCRTCHTEITEAIDAGVGAAPVARSVAWAHAEPLQRDDDARGARPARADEPISCIRCHRYVGHWVR